MEATARPEPAWAVRLLLQAVGGRVSIPLSVVRNQAVQLSEKVSLEFEAASPGLRVRGETGALGAPIDFSARIDADGVHVEGERRTVRVRLSEVELSTPDDAPGPLADAIRNRMIDTENPATLIGNMVALPDMVVEASGRDVVVDLMRVPAIRQDETRRTLVEAATSYFGITEIRVAEDAIELRLGFLPGGVKEAALSTARAALMPAVRYLWPEGRRN